MIQRDNKRADERIFALDELVQQYKADLASSQKKVDQIRRERDAAKQQVEERVVELRELKLQLKQYKIEMKLSQTQRDQALQERDAARQQVEATMVELEQLNNEMKQISAQQQIASRNSEGPYQVELELEFEDDDSLKTTILRQLIT